MNTLVKVAGIAVSAMVACAGCGDKPTNSGSSSNTNSASSSSSSPLTAPVDYLGALGKAQQTAVKTVDVTSLREAIQMFQVENDRYPKDLNELVEAKVMARIPALPKGMKYSYDPKTGKLAVVKE